MKYRLDPLSPNGLSPVGEERVIIKNGGGAVHTGAKFLNDLGDVNVSGGATDNQALAWDDATQKWIPQTISGGSGAVDSVNGQTGVVVLDADDIDDTSTTNKFVTAAEKSDISTAVQPGDLATVATTGDYTDLSNTPTIPTSVDDLNPSQTGNSGKFLTTDGTNSSWASIPGGGDMLASTYDPQNIAGDAFSQDNMTDGTTNKNYTATEKTKLAGIEDGAEVNNISDANATDLTDSGDTALHYHSADRNRANHTGTQTASTISDFDTEVSNNTDVAANTAARHAAVTVTDSSEIDFTLTGQNITASLVTGSIDESKLDTSVNASLDLADSATQPGDNVSTLTNDAGYLASVTAADVDSEASTDGYVLTSDGIGGAAWEAAPGGGSGDVTAASSFGTDNVLIRSDGTGKGVQSSGIVVDDLNNLSGIADITMNDSSTVTIDNGALGGIILSSAGIQAYSQPLTLVSGSTIELGLSSSYLSIPSGSSIRTNTISETTAAAGVTIDGVLLKDGVVGIGYGGTGSALTDPNADRIMFWDDSAGVVTWLAASTGLTISGTNMTVRSASESQTGIAERATDAEFTTGTDTTRYVSANQVANVSQVMANKTLTTPKIVNSGYISDENGNEQIAFGTTTSAVNYIKVTNGDTLTAPQIQATGDDTNVSLNLTTKGAGSVLANGTLIATANNTLTLSNKTLVQSGWTTPTLTNSWVDFGTPYAAAKYMKDSMGFVHIKGLVKSGAAGNSIFTLPAGYRVASNENLYFSVPCSGGVADLVIASDGTVKPYNNTSGSNVSSYVSISITFLSEA